MIKKYIFTLIVINFAYTSSFAQDIKEDDTVISFGTKVKIHSDILDEEREVYIQLPENHDPEKKYPVVYSMDANFSFEFLVATTKHLNNSLKIPEVILVSITNTDRVRDLTPTNTTVGYDGSDVPQLKTSGGTDNFRAFLSKELIPYIEKNYTNSTFRILNGHSFGGLMVTDSFLDEPELFNAYIAVDPSFWWDDNVMTKLASEKLDTNLDTKRFYYMSMANNSGTGEDKMLPTQIAFEEVIKKQGSETIIYKSEYFENEDHGSVGLLSYYNAMTFIFNGYKIKVTSLPDEPSFIDQHFELFSENMGYQFEPDEKTVNFIAYVYMFEKKDVDAAIKLFERNVANYPNSANVYDSLGDAYKEKGDLDKARESYEKALSIDPEYGSSKRKLEAMNKKETDEE